MGGAAGPWSVPAVPAGYLLAITADALVSGVHFPRDTPHEDVAWKALAANLSDLAAMGADPLGLQAECAAPSDDADWADRIATALDAVAAHLGLDVGVACRRTAGPSRRVAVQAMGSVPREGALTRAGARPGDELWVSGTLGDAGAGLAIVQGRLAGADAVDRAFLLERLARPQPRLALGRGLRGIAGAAIDLSDGIVGDAGHVARRSGVAVTIHAGRLPLSGALRRTAGAAALDLALGAGDDYELLFSAPSASADRVRAAAAQAGVPVCRVGAVRAGEGVRILDADGRERPPPAGFRHFADPHGDAP